MNIQCSSQLPDRSETLLLPVLENVIQWPEEMCENGRTIVDAWIRDWKFSGSVGSTAWVPCPCAPPKRRYFLLVGMGSKNALTPVRWRRAWASAGRACAVAGLTGRRLAWAVPSWMSGDLSRWTRLAAEGLLFGHYDLPHKRQSKADGIQDLIIFGAEASKCRPEMLKGIMLASALNEIRDWANQAANHLPPAKLASYAAKVAQKEKLLFSKWTYAQLEKLGCGAFCSVSKGSKEPGCLIRLEWKGSSTSSKTRPLVILGKAITFDSGGVSLKPGKGMDWMKFDKSGGMTALAVVVLAAKLKLKQRVVVYIPAAENMPDGGASRPGDVVKAKNGISIEILNTDAEGRLVLADAMCMAAADKPAAMVDIATLTGAAVIALGHEATAAMGNDENLLAHLKEASHAVGESIWELPMWEEYGEMMKGTFADLRNVGDGSAGTITGGKFLQKFVPAGVPWVHLDVAGTAYLESPKPWGVPGATLACARLLVEWISHQ